MNSIFDKIKRNSLSIIFISLFLLLFFYLLSPYQFFKTFQKNEVVITYADNISDAHQMVVDRFNEKYKGKIRVETINLPFVKFSTNERKELLTRSLRSKSTKLDVFAIDLIWSARFAKWAEPLSRYIVEQDTIGLLPQAIRSCLIDNQLVALPMYLDIGILYYRKDLIEALPNSDYYLEKLKNSITWKDFIELSKQFDPNSNPFYIFPADNYEGLVCSFIEILFNQNSNFFNNSPVDWTSDEIKNSFKMLDDLINKYKITPSVVTDYRETSCYDYFIYNQGVFLRGWASFTKDSKALQESIEKLKLIGQTALPHIEGSKPNATIGGWNIMLSKYSDHKAEAIEFIKFVLSEESQKIYYRMGALLPVISSIYENENFISEFPELIHNKAMLDNGVHRPVLDNYTKISDVISFYLNRVMKGQLNVETAIELANQSLISGELILR